MIKTIIFDIGGVVAHTNFEAIYPNFAKRVELSPEFVIKYHKEKMLDMILGNMTLDQFWKDMKDAGANPGLDLKAIWIDEVIKNREVNQELLSIIGSLRKNCLVGVLTDLTPHRLIIDEIMNLYSHFDYAILSCKEHLKKPDPKFYQLGLTAASAKPEEAIFIDDTASHVAAAEEIGMMGIIYIYPDNVKLLEDLKQLSVSI